jgi:hypothetical protein
MQSTEEILMASRARVEASHARILRSTISEYEARRVIERSVECVSRSRLLLEGVIETSNAGSPVVWAHSLAAAQTPGSGSVCDHREQSLRKLSRAVTMHYEVGDETRRLTLSRGGGES